MLLGTFAFASLLGTRLLPFLLGLHISTELTMGPDGVSLVLLGLVKLSEGVEFGLFGGFLFMLEFSIFQEEWFFIFFPQAARFIAL